VSGAHGGYIRSVQPGLVAARSVDVLLAGAGAILTVAMATACTAPLAPPRPSAAAGCPDVDVVFARGTNQPPGFGRVGDPFLRTLTAGLPGRTVSAYAVDYAADSRQDFGPGATDITRHVSTVASTCPATRFVLGGYSQGALAVAASIGVPVGSAAVERLSPTLSPRVAAVVVFGDPLGARRRSIETADTMFRAQSTEFCNVGDAVCGSPGPDRGAHGRYPNDGSTDRAASFALAHLRS